MPSPAKVDTAASRVHARRSPRSSLPAARSSGRLAAARRSRRRCRLARTRPEKPVRTPGGSGRLGCSRLSRPPIAPGFPRPTSPFPTIVLPMFGARHRAHRAHPPSAASRRRSLRFAQRRRHVRRQDASRVFPAARVRWRRALRDCGDADTSCCVRVWCLIARPLGRDWVCV